MLIRFLTIFTLTISLIGCASVQMADTALDATAKKFQANPSKSGLYIYRNESMGAAIKMDLTVDGKAIGQSAAKTYFYVEVEPGKHTISSKAENTDNLTLETVAGKLYYIWQEVKIGFLLARTKLSLVDDKTGQAGVNESKLAVGN